VRFDNLSTTLTSKVLLRKQGVTPWDSVGVQPPLRLIIPFDPFTDSGPPFYVQPQHHFGVLEEGWEKFLDVFPVVTLEIHVGRLIIWKMKEWNEHFPCSGCIISLHVIGQV
jgi:hypothetical protein